ncbi:MAG: chorismate pyruvate-lyase family protein [Candidatus Helarchaeota archaeon]
MKKILPLREEELSPLHRILLHTNGTVTEVLRQWTNANIIIVKPLLNTCFLYDKLNKHKLFFECKKANGKVVPESSMLREVILRNASNKHNLVYAFTLVYNKNINRRVKYKLDHTDYGIGMIIEQERLETYRQIEEFKKISVEEFPFFKKIFPKANQYILHRAYNIFHNKKLWFTINEYFPSEPEHFDFQISESDKKRILNYSRDILKNE